MSQDNGRYDRRVPHVQAQSPVSATNTSAATRALEDRTNYLYNVLQSVEAGQLLCQRSQPTLATVRPGDAVYWRESTGQYEPALATMIDLNGTYVAAESARCIGLCLQKQTATTGLIGLYGITFMSRAVLVSLIGETIESGQYFLSAATPGKLVRQQPPMTIPVMTVLGPINACEDGANVLIAPQFRDFLREHIHHQVDLYALPAGTHTPPGIDAQHTITDANVDLPGWLPADHASFGGNAPAGAAFGYNLAAHPQLSQLWPPVPVSAVVLECYQPSQDVVLEVTGLKRVPPEFVRFDQYGIWWMTDCWNQVPWPSELDTTSSESSQSASPLNCPITGDMRLILSFVKMTLLASGSVVTSLTADTDQPISFVNCFGMPATTGNLLARLNTAAMIASTTSLGSVVLKSIDSGLRFNSGRVTEGLIAGSSDVILSSTVSRRLDPNAAASTENPVVHQGIVTVDVQRDLSERELAPQIVLLNDALERVYLGAMYIGFPDARTSSITIRLNVPINGLPTSPLMKIRGSIFGRAAGPFSELTVEYLRLVRPTAGNPTPLDDTQTAVTFDVVTPSDDYDDEGTNLPANNLIEVESDTFEIAAGDTIFVTISRDSAASPLYAAEIGILRLTGVIVGA